MDPRNGSVSRESLDTSRLVLLRPTPGDVKRILEIHSDPRATLHIPADTIRTLDAARDLYSRWDAHWCEHGFGYWTVQWRGGGTVMGFCGIKSMNLGSHPVLNLFYRFDPEYWGRGVATEAARAVVDFARSFQPEIPVIARVRPGNEASGRVASKAGLVHAPEFDTSGEDGTDYIFTSSRSALVNDDPSRSGR